MQQLNPPKTAVPVTLKAPRVGGINANGAWTGHGEGGLGTKPKSGLCHRAHSFSDKAKCLSELNKVEIACKAGLKEKPTHPFTLPVEQGKTGLSDCLLEFETFVINTEMEGVFTLITRDGLKVNMFRECGKLDDDLVEDWCTDPSLGLPMTKRSDGSHDGDTPCDCDDIVLEWSGDALMNTTFTMMKKTLERIVMINERSGPRVLWGIISHSETNSAGAVRILCDELQLMSLRKIPGENMQTFATQALEMVTLIRSKCRKDGEPDDLTQLALRGATDGSDEGLRIEAKQLLLSADKPGNKTTPEQALTQLTRTWRSAVDLTVCGPHESTKTAANPSHRAMAADTPTDPAQAILHAFEAILQRQSSGASNGPIICHKCGGENHFSRDCTSTDSTSGSSSISSLTSNGNNCGNQRGLSESESAKVNQLIRAFKLPDTISDADCICVTDEKGQAVGECCKKCCRITKKGPGMHHTASHKLKASLNQGTGSKTSRGTDTQNNPTMDTVTKAALADALKLLMSASNGSAPPADVTEAGSALLQLQGVSCDTPLAGLICRSIPKEGSILDKSSCHDAHTLLSDAPSKDCGGQGH